MSKEISAFNKLEVVWLIDSAIDSDIIEFRVGPKCNTFKIHRNFLVTKSKYIRVDPEIYLPTCNPDAFPCIYEWLYRQTIPAFSM
jgi:hypothetical protein